MKENKLSIGELVDDFEAAAKQAASHMRVVANSANAVLELAHRADEVGETKSATAARSAVRLFERRIQECTTLMKTLRDEMHQAGKNLHN